MTFPSLLAHVVYFTTRAEALAAGYAAAPVRSKRHISALSSGYADVNYGRPWLVEWTPVRGAQRILTDDGWRTHAQGFDDR